MLKSCLVSELGVGRLWAGAHLHLALNIADLTLGELLPVLFQGFFEPLAYCVLQRTWDAASHAQYTDPMHGCKFCSIMSRTQNKLARSLQHKMTSHIGLCQAIRTPDVSRLPSLQPWAASGPVGTWGKDHCPATSKQRRVCCPGSPLCTLTLFCVRERGVHCRCAKAKHDFATFGIFTTASE